MRFPRANGASGFAVTSGARVIDSTPPATKRSPSPAITAWQAPTTAESPDAQSRLTVTPATESGRPGEQRGEAGDVPVVLARLVRAAEPDVLDLGRGDAGALDRRRDGDRGEVVGTDPGEPAAVAADRRPHGREDDGPRHASLRPSVEDALRDRERRVRRRHAAVDGALQ